MAKLVVGNWKMYKTIGESVAFIKELAEKCPHPSYIAVPFTALQAASKATLGTQITIGAQNMHDHPSGAYTGEISAPMLKDAGAQFVILGHSERRHVFGETNEFINHKVKMALKEGLKPILCIGETLQEYESGKTELVLKEQLEKCLEGISINQMIIAYEPVWAIGTGKTATPEGAEAVHAFCRAHLNADCTILYGGSVKPENTSALMAQKNIDGVLVGGASLSVDSFAKIITHKLGI